MVNEYEPETQGVAAEGRRRTDFTDTAVDLACLRAYFLYVYSDIGYDGCRRHWSLRALARLTGAWVTTGQTLQLEGKAPQFHTGHE